jgi:Glycogen recognition site of AMP-activated protein kinase
MDPTTVPRSVARLQYAAVRLPFTVLEERLVARRWGEGASVRLGYELFLGSLDRVAGCLLADEQISGRGRALMRRTGPPAKAGPPEPKAPVQPAHHGRLLPPWPAGPAATAGTTDVRFTLPAEVQAGTVALCGEFNNWSAHDTRLERGGDGSWQAAVALEPGRSYRYRFLLDGERWENAWQADRYAPNSYGSTDSVVVVE